MIDINDRAISLVRDNLTLNKVKANVFSSDVYSNVNKKYDYIILMDDDACIEPYVVERTIYFLKNFAGRI